MNISTVSPSRIIIFESGQFHRLGNAGRRVCQATWLLGALLLVAPSAFSVSSRGAEVEPIKTGAARWIAADAVAWLEVPRPELVIDRLTDPRIESYLKVLPQYQKYVKSKDFRELRNVVESVATQLDTTWEQGLRDLTKGGVLLGLEVDAGSPSPPRVYLIVSPANTASTRSTLGGRTEVGSPGRKEQWQTGPGQDEPIPGNDRAHRQWRKRPGFRDRFREAGRFQLGQKPGAIDRPSRHLWLRCRLSQSESVPRRPAGMEISARSSRSR